MGDTEMTVDVTVSDTVKIQAKKDAGPAGTEQILDLTVNVTEVADFGTIPVAFTGVRQAS
jgi:hypothetical protein